MDRSWPLEKQASSLRHVVLDNYPMTSLVVSMEESYSTCMASFYMYSLEEK